MFGCVFSCSSKNLAYRLFFDNSSSWVPWSTIFPLTMTIIRSAFSTVLNLWAIIIEVRPFISRSIDRWISLSVSLSRAEVASSKIMRDAFLRNALAIAILWHSPPENPAPVKTIPNMKPVFIITRLFRVAPFIIRLKASVSTTSREERKKDATARRIWRGMNFLFRENNFRRVEKGESFFFHFSSCRYYNLYVFN